MPHPQPILTPGRVYQTSESGSPWRSVTKIENGTVNYLEEDTLTLCSLCMSVGDFQKWAQIDITASLGIKDSELIAGN